MTSLEHTRRRRPVRRNPLRDELRESRFASTFFPELAFYGVDGYRFKLNDMVFEVDLDPSDSNRIRDVVLVEDGGGTFFRRPIARVFATALVDEPPPQWGDGSFSGYALVDAEDGHVWLKFGIRAVPYYPLAIFDYQPKRGD